MEVGPPIQPVRVEVAPSPIKAPEQKAPIPPAKEGPTPQEVDQGASRKIEEARSVIAQQIPPPPDESQENVLIKKATLKLKTFDEAKEHYRLFKKRMGIVDEEKKVSSIQAVAGELAKIVGKFADDGARRRSVMEMVHSGKIALDGATLKINVMDRTSLIEDPSLLPLWDNPENREVLTQFAGRELMQEVNATHWLMVTGVSVEQLHAIVYEMGHNPTTKLSGDRGENAGRIAIDNYPEDMQIDASDPRYVDEVQYWQQLFPGKLLPKAIQKWHMSRNHSVVYSVKDREGKDVIMLPIHMDPKNWVVTIKELLSGKLFNKKKGEKSALDYHGLPQANKRYLGTGLYELGASQFIHLLRRKQPGLFGELVVEGEEKLDTTKTISGDDAEALVLENVFEGLSDSGGKK